MQTKNGQPAETASAAHAGAAPGLPAGAEVQRVAFVSGDDPAQTTLLELERPRSCRAILLSGSAAQPAADLTLLLVPTDEQEDPELIEQVWGWVEPGVPQARRRGVLITLHGARIIWSPGRAGLIASADRLAALRLATIDFSFCDAEIRGIEEELARLWPNLEADTPLAFRFDGRAAAMQDKLAQRFQQVIGLRARLVRLAPALAHPPVHPPTLASQLSERLKERTELSDRVELIDDQLEVVEDVYEMCGNRSSEFTIARSQARLEWLIVLLLTTETILLLVDLLSANGI
jgi:hypothetical protein